MNEQDKNEVMEIVKAAITAALSVTQPKKKKIKKKMVEVVEPPKAEIPAPLQGVTIVDARENPYPIQKEIEKQIETPHIIPALTVDQITSRQ